MKIDDNEKITIWLAGNTGLRNPMRIHEGFKVFARSAFVGNLHERENELAFMRFLNDEGIIQNQDGKDTSGSHARKWRLMFERYGFIYGSVKKKNGFTQEEYGKVDEITPFGKIFLSADTVPAIQECFLRALGVEQYWLPDYSGHYSYFRWILAIMLELEKRTGSSEMSRMEFGLWGHTTNPSYDINNVVEHILDFRERRKVAVAKRKFDTEEIKKRGKYYDKKEDNFLDYCDMNMRYLRISGVLLRKGRGIIIAPAKHVIAEAMAKSTASTTPIRDSFFELVNGPSLPTDDITIAKNVLCDLQKQMKEKNIAFDITEFSLDTITGINMARKHLESILWKTDEINYAAKQRSKWQEISDYMSLLISGKNKKEYSDDYVIEIPKEEKPAYFEWILWRAALAIDHLENKPYEVRGFRLDSDFLPVSAAGGGKGDLYWEFKDFVIVTEVTMSTSSRQESMEGEPVRRHVSDAVLKYNKPVLGMFIAVRIDTNTAETFRNGIWYTKDNQQQRLKIIPLTLEQFQRYFNWMFRNNVAFPEELRALLENCANKRGLLKAPEWKKYIEAEIIRAEKYFNRICNIKQVNGFPIEVRFGTRIYNTVEEKEGIVIGVYDKYIYVVLQDDVEPEIRLVSLEQWEQRQWIICSP